MPNNIASETSELVKTQKRVTTMATTTLDLYNLLDAVGVPLPTKPENMPTLNMLKRLRLHYNGSTNSYELIKLMCKECDTFKSWSEFGRSTTVPVWTVSELGAIPSYCKECKARANAQYRTHTRQQKQQKRAVPVDEMKENKRLSELESSLQTQMKMLLHIANELGIVANSEQNIAASNGLATEAAKEPK